MKKVTIATFISNTEKFNADFFELFEDLKQFFDVEAIIFGENYIEGIDENIKQIITPKTTKYKRIERLIEISENNDILCVDNDVRVNKDNIRKFVNKVMELDYAIAWGKVKSKNAKGMVPNLIKIDKNLSHDFIRPLLWKLNIGISVPGQIFMINKKCYIGKFQDIDTVFDDLTLGIIAKLNGMPVYFNNDVLGYETPKGDFKNLFTQRRRWAKGLAESIYNNRNNKCLKYVKIHRFMYHFLWIVYYVIFTIISMVNFPIGVAFFIVSGLLLAEFKLQEILYGYIYMIIFPIVHIVWFKAHITHLRRLYSNKH